MLLQDMRTQVLRTGKGSLANRARKIRSRHVATVVAGFETIGQVSGGLPINNFTGGGGSCARGAAAAAMAGVVLLSGGLGELEPAAIGAFS